jgi:protein-L-isoaspartate(D-aspartate) O-methyltransferase
VDAIVEAFARVAREEFLGPAPWQIGQAQLRDRAAPYITTRETCLLEDIYQDVVVAIDPARQINNG